MFNPFLAGFVLFALVAWCSVGYHHPDEHFQLLELANYKLHATPAEDLPWEFHEQIRPGLQPWLAYSVLGSMDSVGWHNPFQQAFVLRLLSGWLVWGMYACWALQLGRSSGDDKISRNLLWLGLTLWFVPYLGVRFSSENWAGLSFLTALLLITQFIEKQNKRDRCRLVLGGLLLGFSFFFRFQMAFALLGLAGWLLYYRKLNVADWAWLILGGILALAAGVCADFWLYGNWAPTAFNYFRANIVENKAANWGTAPWWFYFREILLSGLPPLSLLLLVLAFWGGWKNRQHAFVWILLPFLLAHLLVGHKELRFLFPMIVPFLALAALAWPDAQSRFGQRGWAKAVLGLAVGVNFLALPLRSLTPANEALPCFRYLYQYAEKQPVTLMAIEKNPYNLVGLTAHFYQAPGLQVQVVSSLDTLAQLPAQPLYLLLYPRLQLSKPLPGLQIDRLYSYFPDWISAFNLNNWQSRSRIWSIYEVKSR